MTRRTLILLAPALTLRADEAREILAKVTAAYQSLTSYRFEGKAVSESTIKGKTTRTELGFVVAFEAPNKCRLEYRYPKAGDWIRVSDGEFLMETRSLSRQSSTTRADAWTVRMLKSSPIYNFEQLSITATEPKVLRTEPLVVDGRSIDCQVIQFLSHRRELREGETAGPSMVWVAKGSGLVLREEIVSTSSERGEVSESRRVRTIDHFLVNEALPANTFSTGGRAH